MEYIKEYLKNSMSVKQSLIDNESILKEIKISAYKIESAYKNGKKVLLAGNGGSAGDAQHIAAEFVSRFFFDRPGLPAIALTTDSSMLTAIGNDYGFEKIFSRQIEAHGLEGDILIAISTSGNSQNIIEAIEVAKNKKMITIALCGEGGAIKNISDISICVPSTSTPHIQECHICIGHIICALVEKNIFSKK